ncbi:hypothetical protein HD595_003706 [Nonomuraea roseoviolacea subsp. carminata]|uniref:Uncharacterized protein n=1 Tax=Nonomuraea roseoviolacea subsp. carminata TaxID=160689 RepID=A0ABT1K3F7_9ACTN|nr:hypothetical protein [Nonomuraea roseoviolacea subsp. carminata]
MIGDALDEPPVQGLYGLQIFRGVEGFGSSEDQGAGRVGTPPIAASTDLAA